MFDIGIFEFVTIAVVALLVFGPDRLPKVTAQATHWLRQIREQAQAARQSITESADIDTSVLKDISELHPRNIAKSVMEPVADVRAPVAEALGGATAPAAPRAVPPAAAPSSRETPAPFDPDAT